MILTRYVIFTTKLTIFPVMDKLDVIAYTYLAKKYVPLFTEKSISQK